MAVIKAKGELPYGNFEVIVNGEKRVKSIECSDLIKPYVKEAIHKAKGTIANGYAPEADTMLQAYAFLSEMFGADHVTVDGDIGELPYEEGVIY